MRAYIWAHNEDPKTWTEGGHIEFTAEAHELVPEPSISGSTSLTVPGSPVTPRATSPASPPLVLEADIAERLGTQLLAAAALSRQTKEY